MPTAIHDLPIMPFSDQKTFADWVAKHHTTIPGVWVKFYKKASGKPTITYDEALDVALCFGWIDSQVKKLDEQSYLQKFSPRKGKSPWSQRNKEHVARLMREGRIQESGLTAIEVAKQNGEWDSAYATPTNMVPPPEFMAALKKNKLAYEFFETLGKTQRFYFLYRIVTAKRPETKDKRIREAIEKLARGEKMNP